MYYATLCLLSVVDAEQTTTTPDKGSAAANSPTAIPATAGDLSRPAPPILERRRSPCDDIKEDKVPEHVRENGADFRRYLNAHITPIFLEGMKQIATHGPEKPIEALGNFFLGVPIVAGTVRKPYRRGGPETAMVMEATKLLACSKIRPENPVPWMGRWLLARSAGYE
jgi:hypothetical protein